MDPSPSEGLDVSGRMRRNPYGMLAAALGVGYVLGGGLFSPTTRRMLGAGLTLGLRLAVLPLLEAQLAALLSGTGDRHESGQAAAAQTRRQGETR